MLIEQSLNSDDLWSVMGARFGDGGGVYVVRAIDDEGAPVSIPRALAVDETGTLYIGQSGKLRGRVIHISQSLTRDLKRRHEVVRRLRDHPGLAEAYPLERLVVDLHPAAEPRKEEKARLSDYLQRFGDYPPLNRGG